MLVPLTVVTRRGLLVLIVLVLLSLLPAAALQAATVVAPAPAGTPLPPLPAPIPAPPVPQDRGPVLALHVTLAPTQIRVGAAALVSVSVTNGSPDAATKLVLAMPVPAGVVALPSAATVGADQGWRWDVGTLQPGASATVTGTLQVTRMLPGGALSLAVTATAAELTSAVRSDGGAILDDPAAEVALAPVTQGRAATLRSADGRVTVTFPAQAATAAVQLRYARPLRTPVGLTLPTLPPVATTPVTTTQPAAPQALPAIAALTDTLPVRDPYGRTGLGSFVLQAATSQGADVRRFTAPLTISVRYTPEQLAALHLAEEDLTLFWFDEQTSTWQSLPTTIDAKTGTASAAVDHFTTFQLSDGSTPSALFVPSLEG